jgi:hypothetical protein
VREGEKGGNDCRRCKKLRFRRACSHASPTLLSALMLRASYGAMP